MKLIGKERVGAKLRKRDNVARTPYQPLRESRDVSLPRCHRLEAEHVGLAPLALKQQTDRTVMHLELFRSRASFTKVATAAV